MAFDKLYDRYADFSGVCVEIGRLRKDRGGCRNKIETTERNMIGNTLGYGQEKERRVEEKMKP